MEWLLLKLSTWNKGFCTWFWDTWFGIYIGDCCYGHDNDCFTAKFFNCIREKFGDKFHATYIAFGGSIGCWLKYTNKMIKYTLEKYKDK